MNQLIRKNNMKGKRLISVLLFIAGVFFTAGEVVIAQNNPDQPGNKDAIFLLTRADDMGNSYGRTLGIIKAHKEGIITSTSIMPASQFFEESVRLCKENPRLVIGIHLTLLGTRTRPVLSPDIVPGLVTPEGFFHETLDQLNKANPKAEELEKEIRAQVNRVRDSGLKFVYLDWHRSVPPAAIEIINRICDEQKVLFGQEKDGATYGYKRIPFMPESWPTQKAPDGQTIHYAAPAFSNEQAEIFFERLDHLKPGKWIGISHPGTGEPQRLSVTELLCSPRTKEIIKRKNIQLVSYHDIWKEEFGNARNK
ncbi:MAG: ChbG/HpnK family deacetylase [Kiritimatiellae bacterium]|nr:ChbG/HpnK family deacetylase [Kiritimatiellia bacterium]MDD5522811.1 ChbG/HpnK family deacetylase [Kiritimatiellia bacterium]